MEIIKAGTRPSQTPNPEYFTGTVQIDPIVDAQPPSCVNALIVTFAPGARTAWHTHPLGQVIHILSGVCWAQRDGGPVERLFPGDTCRFAPGEKHWHGASGSVGMVHLALQESQNGSAADWLEPVSDADYTAGA